MDQVHYANDGSENLQDSIVFEVEFNASAKDQKAPPPAFLRARQRLLLQVKVRPVNDIPRIDVPDGVLRVALGTRKQLSADMFTVHDPDNAPSELIITLAAASQRSAHFENLRFPNKRKTSFSLADLNAGNVFFVYDSNNPSSSSGGTLSPSMASSWAPASGMAVDDIGLTVSDGRDIGNSVVIRLETFVLHIYVVNNTGLTVASGSSSLLTSYNLTFTTNAPEQNLNLR